MRRRCTSLEPESAGTDGGLRFSPLPSPQLAWALLSAHAGTQRAGRIWEVLAVGRAALPATASIQAGSRAVRWELLGWRLRPTVRHPEDEARPVSPRGLCVVPAVVGFVL